MPSARKTSQVIGRVSKSHLLKKIEIFFYFPKSTMELFFYINTAQICKVDKQLSLAFCKFSKQLPSKSLPHLPFLILMHFLVYFNSGAF